LLQTTTAAAVATILPAQVQVQPSSIRVVSFQKVLELKCIEKLEFVGYDKKLFEENAALYLCKMEFNTAFAFETAGEATTTIYVKSFGVGSLSEDVDRSDNSKVKVSRD
jgi:hypothetical protein